MRNFTAKIQFDYGIYRSLVLRFLLAMLLFTLCRLAFFAFNHEYYPQLSFDGLIRILGGGLVFDLTAVLYINLLFIALQVIPFKFRHNASYQQFIKYLFFITNGLALAINCADIIYFEFTLKRTTASVFEVFSGEPQMGKLFLHYMVDYWYITTFWVLLLVLMVTIYNRIGNHSVPVNNGRMYYLTGTIAMLICAYLTVVGIRGGFTKSTRPITLNNAGKYIDKPIEMALVLNTPFCIFRTIDKKAPVKYKFFNSESKLNAVYNPVYQPSPKSGLKKENVMIIILESFSREYIGSLNPDIGKGYTPFLDSLVEVSLSFSNAYANGMKSIDALPAVVSSIPALVHPFVSSQGSMNKINSLASLLGEKGYRSTYFYGGPNGSMGYEAFVNLAEFDNYVGKNEYGNNEDFDGVWGVWDEEFFQFTVDQMKDTEEPFCNVLMSVSSHHPFKVPAKYEGRFRKGPNPHHEVVGYTDYALKRFFERASTMEWFDNTLFVITADHSSGHVAPPFKTAVGLFAVPILFYKSGSNLKGKRHSVAQQIDILPTVLNYLNYDEPFVAFGNDLFNDSTNHFALNYGSGSYQIISNEYALQFNGERTFGLYNYREDKLFEHNLIKQLPVVKDELELNLKAMIQQYNFRLSEDRMTAN